jgi:hypothetical protein
MRTQGRLTRIRGKLNLPWGMFNLQRVPINLHCVPINLYRARTNPVWGSNEIEWGRDVLPSAVLVLLWSRAVLPRLPSYSQAPAVRPLGALASSPAF